MQSQMAHTFKLGTSHSLSKVQSQPVMMTAVGVTHNEKDMNNSLDNSGDRALDLFEVKEMPVSILALNIQEAVDMSSYTAAKFSRVKNNILAALSFLKRYDKQEHDTNQDKNDMDVWKEVIASPQNHSLINDGFWLVVLKKNSNKFVTEQEHLQLKKKASSRIGLAPVQAAPQPNSLYHNIENAILDRMACSYHELLETFRGEQYELFFQVEIPYLTARSTSISSPKVCFTLSSMLSPSPDRNSMTATRSTCSTCSPSYSRIWRSATTVSLSEGTGSSRTGDSTWVLVMYSDKVLFGLRNSSKRLRNRRQRQSTTDDKDN